MASSRDIRRLAFQTLYQLDARGSTPADAEAVRESLSLVAEANDDDLAQPGPPSRSGKQAGGSTGGSSGDAGEVFTSGERRKAFELAMDAFAHRADADAFMLELAPDWPSHRQAAVDRAILRLAHWEMVSSAGPAGSQPKIAVNEAIELAKEFSTEKSPAFINGLLDKVLKKVLRTEEAAADVPAVTHDGA
jgi:transcription antitermination factor NusB